MYGNNRNESNTNNAHNEQTLEMLRDAFFEQLNNLQGETHFKRNCFFLARLPSITAKYR